MYLGAEFMQPEELSMKRSQGIRSAAERAGPGVVNEISSRPGAPLFGSEFSDLFVCFN